jgi:hypothetical protein
MNENFTLLSLLSAMDRVSRKKEENPDLQATLLYALARHIQDKAYFDDFRFEPEKIKIENYFACYVLAANDGELL